MWAFAVAPEAVERSGGPRQSSLVRLRSYQHTLALVRRDAFTTGELGAVRDFGGPRGLDLDYLPDTPASESARCAVLPNPGCYQVCVLLPAPRGQGTRHGSSFCQ